MLVYAVSASAHTVGNMEFHWQHFGAAPYALSRTKAMQTRESAFIKLGLPHQVVALFMETTKKPGKEIRLVNGDRLSAMLSRGGIVHRNVLVDFTTPPISGNMEYAAPAEEWQITWRGRIYVLILPKICNNWSVRIAVSASSSCVTVTFHVQPGDQVRYAVFTHQGERLPSSCWSLSDGEEISAAPSPCTVCNWVGPLSILPNGFSVKYSGLYRAHSRTQVLRFPRKVIGDYIALCITRVDLGESDSWIIPPSRWREITILSVHVPYDGKRWPVWGSKATNWSLWKNKGQ